MTTNIDCRATVVRMENCTVDTNMASYSGSISARAAVEKPTPAVHSGAFTYNCDYSSSIIEHAFHN